VLLVAYAALLLWGCALAMRRQQRQQRQIPCGDDLDKQDKQDKYARPDVTLAGEWAMFLTLAALPFCGYLLARFVTHSIEVRYVLGAVVALAAMTAIAMAPLLRRDGVFAAVLVLLGVSIVAADGWRIRAERRATADRLASLVLPHEVAAALAANPDGRLYVQDMGAFEEDRFYVADPALRARITLVYSPEQELRYNRHDTMALTAEHLRRFSWLPIVSYDDLRATPGEHIFALFHTGWDWTDQAFAAGHATVRPLGHAFHGDIAAVQFVPPPAVAP
jgi:hypothetical protein